MAELKTRKIKRMTTMGKVVAYGPLLASSGLLASHIVGKPWLRQYTLFAALTGLICHEFYFPTKNPKFEGARGEVDCRFTVGRPSLEPLS